MPPLENDAEGKWPDPADPQYWIEQVTEGRRFQRDFGNSNDWGLYRNYYRGKFPTPFDRFFYNLYYIYVRTMMPSLYYRHPHMIVTPMKNFGPDPDLRRAIGGRILESVDAVLLKKMRMKDVVRDVIFDALCCNRGLVKVGYSSEFSGSGGAERGRDDQEGRKAGERSEYNRSVRNGMPWVSRTDPETFIVPFGTRRKEHAPWCCHMILRPTQDVKNSTYYKSLVKTLRGSHISLLDEYFQANDLQGLSDKCDWTEIHEIFDHRTGKVGSYIPSFSEETGRNKGSEWIRDLTAPNIMTVLEDDPFEDLCFNEDPLFFWGPSDFRQLEPSQREINSVKLQTHAHRQIAILRFLYAKGLVDPAEVSKFLEADWPGAAIPVNGNPEVAIKMLQPYIPQDLIMWAREVNEDARVLTGAGKQQSGVMQGGRKTATEANLAQAGFDLRVSEKRDAVADFLARTMDKVNRIVANYWTEADVLPVVGLDGAMYWVEFSKEILTGNYNVRIDADELAPTSLAARRNEIMQLISTMGPSDYLFRQLASLYDWADLPSILPQGNAGQVMQAGQFAQQQAGMQPEMRQAGLGQAIQAMQSAPPASEAGLEL